LVLLPCTAERMKPAKALGNIVLLLLLLLLSENFTQTE
jgi:hypothetical protein